MRDTLREQLQTSLGPAYTLERELSGGGMSRVFVARDEALGRAVVVKVLAPELAEGLSAERFTREIRLAAALQEPHIVPVLAAGATADRLPWYTMPYIDGESLRHRLGRGPLPMGEALSILRDVARALAYAHARGIVHRDIKPENVLMSGGTAVVTDFGIAKALSVSKTQAPGGPANAGTLTQVGTSLGTPAYMAPEQAAGGDVDARADLYAWGVMAYELLSGRHPFAERTTAQQLITAHMVERPRPVGELRADAPAALAALVMHCLEKDPDARPASADVALSVLDAATVGSVATPPAPAPATLRRALVVYAAAFGMVALLARVAIVGIGLPDWVFPGALVTIALVFPAVLVTGYTHRLARHAAVPTVTPGGSAAPMRHSTVTQIALRASPHLSWRRTARLGLSALGAFGALVAGFMALRAQGVGPFGSLLAAGAMQRNDVVVVADFASAGDTTLGRAVAQGVKADLAQSRAMSVLDDARVADLLHQMRRDDDRLPLAVAREVAQRAGAKVVVDGTVTPLGSGFLVSLRLVTADSGRELVGYQASVDSPGELIAAVGTLTRRLRDRIGESLREVQGSPRLEAVTTASLEALRAYTEAYRATGAGDRERAIALARQAVAIDTGFALAWRALSEALRNAGYAGAPVDSALEHAYALRSRLTPRERLVVIADYFGSGPGRDRARAIAAYDSLFAMGDRQNTNSLVSRLITRREFARAESLSRERIRVDPEYVLTYSNLAYSQLRNGRVAAADSTIALASRRFPGWSARWAYLLAGAQYAHGNLDSAIAILERARGDQLGATSSSNLTWLADLVALRGEFARERRLRGDLGAALASRTPARAVTDTVRAVVSDVWRLGPAPRHVARLDAALASPSLTARPPVYRPYLMIAAAYARAGSPGRARAVLARYEAEVADTAQRRVDLPGLHDALGEIALAEGRHRDAVVEFRRGDVLPDGPAHACLACLPAALARVFDAAGEADSTIAAIEQYLRQPAVGRLASDGLYLAPFSKRLAELYEARGDVARALDQYRQFVTLWKHADPELQPMVAEVRRRVARLEAREGRAR